MEFAIMAAQRILVVDDDRGTCAILSRKLASHGYDVDVAYDGKQALDRVSQQSYDLALIDYRMPGLNGVELFERLRQEQPDIVGVFLTAFANINTVYPAIGVGIERVLAKPVDFNELIPVIEELAGKPTPH
jgi:CheY-like chemotaxis protein